MELEHGMVVELRDEIARYIVIDKNLVGLAKSYTKEELQVFYDGISNRLCSLKSAQHWGYDEKTAKKIAFLERLFEKVKGDMNG